LKWGPYIYIKYKTIMESSIHIIRAGVAQSLYCDYRLANQMKKVQAPKGEINFSSSLCVQTNSEADPASCAMGTTGPFPRVKTKQGLKLTTDHLVPR
jgi:hypothetical protein